VTRLVGRRIRLVSLLLLLCQGCRTASERPPISAPSTLPLQSPAFADAGPIPVSHTCDGENASPPLAWSVPPSVAEYALTMVDLDARGFVHWVAYAIPADTSGVTSGRLPEGSREGQNGFGRSGYGGPCPPGGDEPHRYEITLYALRKPRTQQLRAGATIEELLEAIRCCVQVFGTLIGTYERR
jgi:Raf kinase inhibitor-like YbhB/YbcL family protein